MPLSTVAVVVPPRPGLFELGVVQEVFGIDRTDDGVPPLEFLACTEDPGTPVELANGMSMSFPHGLEAADRADLVVAPAYDYSTPPSEAVLDSYAKRDVAKALGVWRDDEEIDAVCISVFRELLTYMMEDPRNIGFCIHLLFCAKNIERMGDHATNIAETVHYMIEGRPIADKRPKGDMTSAFSSLHAATVQG